MGLSYPCSKRLRVEGCTPKNADAVLEPYSMSVRPLPTWKEMKGGRELE